MVCKIGDGKGSSEKLIGGSYTIQECIEIVKEQHPTSRQLLKVDGDKPMWLDWNKA